MAVATKVATTTRMTMGTRKAAKGASVVEKANPSQATKAITAACNWPPILQTAENCVLPTIHRVAKASAGASMLVECVDATQTTQPGSMSESKGQQTRTRKTTKSDSHSSHSA